MNLPEPFLKQMESRLGKDLPDFLDSLDYPVPVSIHYNPLKSSKSENFDGVKWYSNGVYLEKRPVFTLDPLFHAGLYYVQEASSMFLAEALKQTVDLSKPLTVLDLAAAPGGKSTILASLLHKESFILCNEVIKSRYNILNYNLSKWGMPNSHVSNHDSKDFSGLKGFFDLIVLDAPCSGEGLFRKDPAAVDHWDQDHVTFCSLRQQRILANAVNLLKPEGIIIYSTCTYNQAENEGNASWLEQNYGLQSIDLKIQENWSIENRSIGYQFYPHKVQGEGFYIACFKKEGGREAKTKTGVPFHKIDLGKKERILIEPWINNPDRYILFKDKYDQVRAILKSHADLHFYLQKHLSRYLPGTLVGTLKRDVFVPSPELALSSLLSQNVKAIEMSLEQALKFLKKEDPQLDQIPDGWAIVKYKNAPLGWVKGIKNRVNNYYPKAWRIRMKIE